MFSNYIEAYEVHFWRWLNSYAVSKVLDGIRTFGTGSECYEPELEICIESVVVRKQIRALNQTMYNIYNVRRRL
jgi:hypothetical protein